MTKTTLKEQLIKVEIAGDLLEQAPMMKTKQAAQMLGKQTLNLLTQLVEKVNEQEQEIADLKERLA